MAIPQVLATAINPMIIKHDANIAGLQSISFIVNKESSILPLEHRDDVQSTYWYMERQPIVKIVPQKPSQPITFNGCSELMERIFSSVTSYKPVNTCEAAINTSPSIELLVFSVEPIDE